MINRSAVIAVITTVLAALFAIYTDQVSSPSGVSFAQKLEDTEFCPASGSSEGCSETTSDFSSTMVRIRELLPV